MWRLLLLLLLVVRRIRQRLIDRRDGRARADNRHFSKKKIEMRVFLFVSFFLRVESFLSLDISIRMRKKTAPEEEKDRFISLLLLLI